MSESLPGAAPLEGEAVGSVEDPAPPSGEEVVTESAPGQPDAPKYVEASRFNGLMGRFNRTQSELERARQRIAELESQLTGPPVQEDSMSNDAVQALQAQVASLQSLLVEQQLEQVRNQAIQEFPGAAPFADLIVANTPEEVRDMARLLHERVQAAVGSTQEPPADESEEQEQEPSGAQTTPPAEPPAPTPPQVAGGTSIGDTQPDPQTRVVEAIQKGNFSDYLRAKWEATKASEGLTL